MRDNQFKIAQWIAWAVAGIGASAALTSFAYQNFELKHDSEQNQEKLEKRLDRIEYKIDALNSQMKGE